MSIKLPVGNMFIPHLLTMDERYIVVILNMLDENYDEDRTERLVFYLDLLMEPLMFVESPFKPEFKADHVIMTGNIELSRKIVHGYKRLFIEEMFIPLDIIEMIVSFYDDGCVHFFEWNAGYHFRERKDYSYKHLMVSINDIIPSYGRDN